MEEVIHSHNGLIDLIVILSISVAVVAFFRSLNLSSVLGYLVVGALIGEHGFNLINDSESTKYLAEFGVVFLLFAIGLELTFNRLVQMRKQVFGFGTLQVLLCAAILGGITFLVSNDVNIAFVSGFVLALSSTAIVIQVLNDRGEEITQYGRLSISTLILQDLAFIPMLIVIPILATGESGILSAIFESVWQGALALAIVVVLGRKIVSPLFNAIASIKNQELFIALTLFIVLGTSFLTQQYGLSLALGAFVAGLLIAETEYRTQVETDLKPFKSLLMGLFFITVGMNINYEFMVKHAGVIASLTAAVIIIKTFSIYFLARIFGFGKSCSIRAGLILSQSGEFAFVLFGLAFSQGIISSELLGIFIATVSISMALTPFLVMFSDYIVKRVDLRNPVHYEDNEIQSETSDLTDHTIVVGFEKVGRTTCDLLKYKEKKYVAIDDSPAEVHKARKEGFPIFFGQCNMLENLEKLGLERAKAVAITINHKSQVIALAKAIKNKYPKITVIARAKDRAHATELKAVGADISIAEAFESSLMIGNFILTSIGLSDTEVEDAIDTFRKKEHPESQIKGVQYKSKEDFSTL